MTSEGHSIGSGGNHKVKKEDAKANGIWRQMSDEEYERKNAEIEVRLEVLMEWLQKEEEDQRYGFLMRRKMRRHKLQKKREQLINAQKKKEILRVIEYLEKDLETKASSGTKGSKSLTSDIFCMIAGTTGEREQTTDVVTEEENGAATCFEDVHAQMEKDLASQHIGSRGDFDYDGGQKLEVE